MPDDDCLTSRATNLNTQRLNKLISHAESQRFLLLSRHIGAYLHQECGHLMGLSAFLSILRHKEQPLNHERMARICMVVEDLVDNNRQLYSLCSGGLFRSRLRYVHTAKAIRDLTDAYREQFSLPIEVRIDGDAADLRLPDPAVRIALGCLLENAATALKTRVSGHVLIAVNIVNRSMEIHVEDNGPGVVEDLADKIWDVGVTTWEKHAGLGLPTARLLVEDLHGSIWHISDKNGSVFTIRVPFRDEQETLKDGTCNAHK